MHSDLFLLTYKLHLTSTTSIEHRTNKMGKKRVLVCYGVDIDAVAGWLGSYGGEDSTSDISRGKSVLVPLKTMTQ